MTLDIISTDQNIISDLREKNLIAPDDTSLIQRNKGGGEDGPWT